jgi:hypothetical protein
MEPRFGGHLKSGFYLVGNLFDAGIGPSLAEVADDPAGEQVGHALSAFEVGEMDVPIAHRGHRGSLRLSFDGWPRSYPGACSGVGGC